MTLTELIGRLGRLVRRRPQRTPGDIAVDAILADLERAGKDTA